MLIMDYHNQIDTFNQLSLRGTKIYRHGVGTPFIWISDIAFSR